MAGDIGLSYLQYAFMFIGAMISGTISMFGSLAIIYLSRRKWKTETYQRLILWLSIVDILYTIFGVYGNIFFTPNHIPTSFWAHGNQRTCTVVGGMSSWCRLAGCLLNTSLSLYFLVCVRFGWRKERIFWWIELPAVVVTILLPTSIMIWGTMEQAYRFVWLRNACQLRGATEDSILIGSVNSLLILTTSGFGFIFTILIYRHVRSTLAASQDASLTDCHESLRVEVAWQSIWYFLAYLNTFLWPILIIPIVRPMDNVVDEVGEPGLYALFFLVWLLSPLQGFLNFCIFIRPKYRQFQKVFVDETTFQILRRIFQGQSLPSNRAQQQQRGGGGGRQGRRRFLRQQQKKQQCGGDQRNERDNKGESDTHQNSDSIFIEEDHVNRSRKFVVGVSSTESETPTINFVKMDGDDDDVEENDVGMEDDGFDIDDDDDDADDVYQILTWNSDHQSRTSQQDTTTETTTTETTDVEPKIVEATSSSPLPTSSTELGEAGNDSFQFLSTKGIRQATAVTVPRPSSQWNEGSTDSFRLLSSRTLGNINNADRASTSTPPFKNKNKKLTAATTRTPTKAQSWAPSLTGQLFRGGGSRTTSMTPPRGIRKHIKNIDNNSNKSAGPATAAAKSESWAKGTETPQLVEPKSAAAAADAKSQSCIKGTDTPLVEEAPMESGSTDPK